MYCLLLLLLEIFNLSGVIFVYRKSGGIDKNAARGVEEVTSVGGWVGRGGGGLLVVKIKDCMMAIAVGENKDLYEGM